MYIYSDSERTILLDTLGINLHSSKKDYRYVYGLNTANSGAAGEQVGYVQNLNLNLPEGVAFNGFPFFFDEGHR